MPNLAIGITLALALMIAGVLAWNAEATTLTSATTAHTTTSYSLLERTGCWLPGNCDVGQYRACDRRGRCKCLQCSGWYPWRANKPVH
jgi:hypothetical protein